MVGANYLLEAPSRSRPSFKQAQRLSVITKCNFLESGLTALGMEIRAELKEILDNLAISDLQIITESSRSGPKFEPVI